jgi:hypothetical protein
VICQYLGNDRRAREREYSLNGLTQAGSDQQL